MKRPKALEYALSYTPKGRMRLLRNFGLATVYVALLIWVGTFVAITLIETPKDRKIQLTEKQIFERVQAFQKPELPEFDDRTKELAKFGSKLFRHPLMACDKCHDPGSGRQHPLQLPLVDLDAKPFFYRDGRAPDLKTAVRKMMLETVGLSRVELVDFVKMKYPRTYQKLFGRIPSSLRSRLPDNAWKYQPPIEVPTHVAAAALETLGDSEALMRMVNTAVDTRTPPIRLLLERTELPPVKSRSIFQLAAYDHLPTGTKIAIDQLVDNIALSVAAYLRGLRSGPSRFDRFVERAVAENSIRPAVPTIFSEQELRGFYVFDHVAQCSRCHSSGQFTDFHFRNIGLPGHDNKVRLGRALGKVIANRECAERRDLCEQTAPIVKKDLGAFMTPSLRFLEPPPSLFFHDSRALDFSQIIAFYNDLDAVPEVGLRSSLLSPLQLFPKEQADLIAFLQTLKSPLIDLNQPQISSRSP